MATKKIESATRPSKVRFVMIEAELNENNSLSELTQAITQALKPTSPTSNVRVLPPVTRTVGALGNSANDDVVEAGEIEEEVSEEANEDETAASAPKTPRPKAKPTTVNFLHSMNVTGNNGMTFKEFAEKHAPDSQLQRYLVAAAWLKDHGDDPTVTIHKMYTCYRTAGWPLKIEDWDSPFRNLVKVNKMRRVSKGEYAITHIGEADLQTS